MRAWPSLDDATRRALIDRAEADPKAIDDELRRLHDAWPTLRARERSLIAAMLGSAERRTRLKANP